MSDSVQMPALGESVTEGTVTRWLKQVGDRVEVDEPLLEVSTDKVDTEIPSPVAGVVQEILVGEDETVAVGAQLAVIGDGSEPSSNGSAGNGAAAGSADSGSGGQASPPEIASPQPTSDQVSGEREVEEQPSTAQPEPVPATAEAQQQGGAGDGQPVTMPALGESVTEGTVTRWLKQVGDEVALDEPLLEVSTDKVDTEIPAPFAGVLQKILVAEDETVPVGTELALVGGTAAAVQPAQQRQTQEVPAEAKAAPAPQSPKQESPKQEAPKPEAPKPAATASPGGAGPETTQQSSTGQAPTGRPATGLRAAESADTSVYVTPLVRRLASQNGVDLDSLTGTGVGGRIRKQDVLDAAAAKEEEARRQQQAALAPAPAAAAAPPAPSKAAPAPVKVSELRGTTQKMSRLRRLVAQRMVESLQTSAQLTTVVEVDVTRIARLRDRVKRDFEAREGAKLSFLPFFALAAVEALKQYPVVNASIDGENIVYHPEENLGIAVDTERGLLVPVIRGAGDLNIAGIARKIADLAGRARNNKISPDDLAAGTFTLTNTGSRGALFDTPILFQPQVAILGTGAVVKRPVVLNDPEGGETIAIRSMVYLALSYDHRIVDGADAARFLASMKQRLEEGAFEV